MGNRQMDLFIFERWSISPVRMVVAFTTWTASILFKSWTLIFPKFKNPINTSGQQPCHLRFSVANCSEHKPNNQCFTFRASFHVNIIDSHDHGITWNSLCYFIRARANGFNCCVIKIFFGILFVCWPNFRWQNGIWTWQKLKRRQVGFF